MSVFLFGAIKGGTGKSTTSINLTVWLTVNGYDTCLIDADPQANSSKWNSYREENADLLPVHSVQKYGNIKAALFDLKSRYDHLVVDTAGKDSKEMRTASLIADVWIIPFQTSQADLDTADKISEVVEEALDLNPHLKVRTLFNVVPTNPKCKNLIQAQNYISSYPLIPCLKTVIYSRQAYRDCFGSGQGVIEMTNKSAIREINSFGKEVLLCQ
jgi:chromosome partitioning protein